MISRRAFHAASGRKAKGYSQSELARKINAHHSIIRRYERNEVKPSIEMATKIAEALQISLDFLVGKTDLELDNGTLKRIQAISKLPEKEKEHVYVFLDSFIDRMKLQGIL